MKTIMVIDSALNCAYDCFAVDEDFFCALFPGEGQDIEFIEDVKKRLDLGELSDGLERVWAAPIQRSSVQGIDGILFFELLHKKKYYPNKRHSELNDGTIQSILAMPDLDSTS